MTATEVKAKILALLDEVADGEEIEITKHGRTVARLVGATGPRALKGRFSGVAMTAVENEDAALHDRRALERFVTTVLLDSHVFHWWSAEPRRLSQAARRAVEQADELPSPRSPGSNWHGLPIMNASK